MFEHWRGSLEAIVILAIAIIVFNVAIQPVLVSIDPMFADQYVPPSEQGRRAPATPAGWATLATAFIFAALYISLRMKIAGCISDGD